MQSAGTQSRFPASSPRRFLGPRIETKYKYYGLRDSQEKPTPTNASPGNPEKPPNTIRFLRDSPGKAAPNEKPSYILSCILRQNLLTYFPAYSRPYATYILPNRHLYTRTTISPKRKPRFNRGFRARAFFIGVSTRARDLPLRRSASRHRSVRSRMRAESHLSAFDRPSLAMNRDNSGLERVCSTSRNGTRRRLLSIVSECPLRYSRPSYVTMYCGDSR